jgi:glyceraldehyde 3-phosphate dehydrogenase
MKTKVLLNGVGRIGKAILRLAQEADMFEIVAINEITPHIDSIAHTINYDSTYGPIADKYSVDGETLVNRRHTIRVTHSPTLDALNLEGIDLIIDASGTRIDRDRLKQLDVDALFLTHPTPLADINIILGVNDADLDPDRHNLISTSSCNATALLPLLKLIDDHHPILSGDILTVHPLLSHQKVLDSGCVGSADRGVACNMEFGRSAVQNIIPSRTTTIEACSYVLPKINAERFASGSLRVPTPTVGAINITLNLRHATSREAIVSLCESSERTQRFDIFLNNHAPLVSSDFQRERFTTIIDHRFTDLKAGTMLKLLIWYDNEWGYASKVVDIVREYIRKSR